MRHAATRGPVAQLRMPGIPPPARPEANASSHNVWPGREVLYVGSVAGGPRYGARGVVKQTRGRRVVVDMGRSGRWRIPYCFLSVPMGAG